MALNKKTGGRVKGTPNKVTSGVKDNILAIIDENFTPLKVRNMLRKMTAADKLAFYTKILPYVVAKPRTIDEEDDKPLTQEEVVDKILSTYLPKSPTTQLN